MEDNNMLRIAVVEDFAGHSWSEYYGYAKVNAFDGDYGDTVVVDFTPDVEFNERNFTFRMEPEEAKNFAARLVEVANAIEHKFD